ncbi:monovalent cation/H(+) antiporter subunit G [Aureimonas glaciei]|uniref:Potassium:proton antiporter n=1 Tax=Aureimonas glaciei TaxID=1776957 RepID=A0A916Y9H6_9HYPH|nr:monovalent cation/H(+) antiporter subunit G [Aureimonas glaciei]GGD34961.1 potassium:proton antiporter [Aureimonas glaciei]
MSHLANLPVWAALAIGILLLAGASITLLGTIGLLRFGSFYERLHAPTLGTTGGALCIFIASAICFSVPGTKTVLHELLLAVFMVVTTPISLMLLGRAALYRDRTERNEAVPGAPAQEDRKPPAATPPAQDIDA